jgi:hypothetical protein
VREDEMRALVAYGAMMEVAREAVLFGRGQKAMTLS